MEKDFNKRTISKPKKYILILLQVLAATCIGVCVGIYIVSAKLTVGGAEESKTYIPSLAELSQPYLESDSYRTNLDKAIDDIARLAVIRSQLETNGEYNGKRIINIGEYANRTAAVPYDGPVAEYYLEDLIRWAQYGVSHIYQEFDTWDEFEEFFGPKEELTEEELYRIEGDTVIINVLPNGEQVTVKPDAATKNSGVPMLDTIINRYQTVDGKNLEECVLNENEYRILGANLESTIESLIYNYKQYMEYMSALNSDTSNIRYLVFIMNGMRKTYYTNTDWYYRVFTHEAATERFREYGSYIYMSLGDIKYQTNTSVGFEQVRNALLSYEYAYPDNTCVWMGIDDTYPNNDFFYQNAQTYKRMKNYLPWLMICTGLCLIIFITVGVVIIVCENRKFSYIGAEDELGDFDRLPLEAELIFGALFGIILYLVNSILLENMQLTVDLAYEEVLPNVALCAFMDTTVTLLFVYSFARRIKCRNVWKKSLIALIFSVIRSVFRRLRKWMWKVYDSSGVAIRTWATYAGFLIFNAFWAYVMFFRDETIVALMILILVDGATGAILFNQNWERKKIVDGIRRISEGDLNYQLDVSRMHGDNKMFADAVNDIGLGIKKAVETSIKDEKLKADLITNVSHDIKTPLTSIINYVDLIKRENVDNDRIKSYVRVLDEKSQRLKQLTVDLVEASKITSGNITLQFDRLNFIELLNQTLGEFAEKFDEKQLVIVKNMPTVPVVIVADSRRMWRIIENLFNNIYKYALESTRVYMDLSVVDNEKEHYMMLSLKNISAQQLNIGADELTERFIRGDVSRSTEGSGLGLSIAKSLTQAQKGRFDIHLDGDLFKATIRFPLAPPVTDDGR